MRFVINDHRKSGMATAPGASNPDAEAEFVCLQVKNP
jgi:hypothetical protein